LDIFERWRRKYRIDLETTRLVLRPLVPEDVDWISDISVDPEVNRFLWDRPKSAKQARLLGEAIVYWDLHACHFGHWAIQDKATNEIHGWTELGKLRPWWGPGDEIAISYVLRRASWGRGIATEAAERLLRYAFEAHRLERVMATIMAGNSASRRILEKLGMRFTRSRWLDDTELQYFTVNAPDVSD